jgi:hypothetical protein
MSEPLLDELEFLAGAVDWPPTPDLVAAVAARVAAQPRAGTPPARRWTARPGLGWALAAVLAALVAVAAIPPARSAVLRLVGLTKGERIVRVEHPPPPAPEGDIDLGATVSLDTARALAGFPIRQPTALGAPTRVQFSAAAPGGVVTLRYGPRTALTELRGGSVAYVEKTLGPGTRLERVFVNGAQGYYLAGASHFVIVRDDAGHVRQAYRTIQGAHIVVWDAGGISYRLETRAPRREALRIARSLR